MAQTTEKTPAERRRRERRAKSQDKAAMNRADRRKGERRQLGAMVKEGLRRARQDIPQQISAGRENISKRITEFQSWFPSEEEEKRVRHWNAAPEDMEYMSDTSAAILQETPRGGRSILMIAVLFFAVMILWASLAQLDEITRGSGKVIPSTQVQVIQNLEGGILEEIFVREGEVVAKGQIIVQLDETRFASSQKENRLKYLALKAKAARLKAEAENSKFVPPEDVQKEMPELVEKEKALYESRRSQHIRELSLAQKELNMTRPLVAEGAISEVEVIRLERQVNEIRGKFRNDARTELNTVNAEVGALEEFSKAAEDRVRRTRVRSPVKGTIKQLKVTTVGGVLQPGQEIAEVVPLEDTLLVEAKVRPSDIAFLHPGQKAVVKFSAYDFAIYGGLDGKVEHISADTIVDEEGESFYLVKVRTDQNYLGSESDPLPIIPGMTAGVDVLTGKKSVLTYLLKPVLRAKQRALTER